MKTLKELNEERRERALGVFTSAQIHAWEWMARRDAENDVLQPPSHDDLLLGEHVYLMAWSRKRDKIGRAERDAAEAAYAAEKLLGGGNPSTLTLFVCPECGKQLESPYRDTYCNHYWEGASVKMMPASTGDGKP
jgi:hypothetical protein